MMSCWELNDNAKLGFSHYHCDWSKVIVGSCFQRLIDKMSNLCFLVGEDLDVYMIHIYNDINVKEKCCFRT